MINIIRALVAFALLVSGIVQAAAPITVGYYDFKGTRIPTAAAFCQATLVDLPSGYSVTLDNGDCVWRDRDGLLYGSRLPVSYAYATIVECADKGPRNSALPWDQQCGSPPPACGTGSVGDVGVGTSWASGPSGGAAIVKRILPPGAVSSSSFCIDKCVVKSSGSSGDIHCGVSQDKSSNGYYLVTCTTPMSKTGAACSGSEPAPDGGVPGAQPDVPNDPGDGKCPGGSVPAGLDPSGMTICQGKGPSAPVPGNTTGTTTSTPPVTSKSPDGSTTTTSTSTTGNKDGSSTTTTTTTTVGSNGNTTTTVVPITTPAPANPDKPGTQDKPEDKNDLCMRHPELTVCSNSQVQGTCGEITCTGDAIQCATLRAAAAMECRDKNDRDELSKSPLVGLGNNIIDGNDPMKGQIDQAMNGQKVDLSNMSLDQSGFVGGGSCLGTKTFTVMGKSVSYSFASVCQNIQPLRYIILACAFLAAYLLVSKSILQS